tara:strand:- start:1978 stop:2460 length:483 start_codon:yes stop_codon:yes gene_type:complete
MPSFDVVSEVDVHQLTNAVDQSNRIVITRFDFKGIDAFFERQERTVTITAEAEFQIEQMLDMLRTALVKCDIDPRSMECQDPEATGKLVRQSIELRHGLDPELCKKLVKKVKEMKLKVQSQIQGDQVRVIGKKRDELQQVMTMLRGLDIEQPLQFSNFRD